MPRRDPFIESAIASLDEMKMFPDDASRRRAVEKHLKITNRPINLIFGSVYLIAACALSYYLLRLACRTLLPGGTPRFVRPVIVIAGTIAVYYGLLRLLHTWGTARDLRKLLIKEGIPVCLKCGYDLRGLGPAAGSCPECGRKIPATTRALLNTKPPAG